MAKFYAILLNAKGGSIPNEAIQAKLDALVSDWLRIASNQYIVSFEGEEAARLHDQIRPLLSPQSNILVVELNLPNRQGWMQKIAVDWISRHSP